VGSLELLDGLVKVDRLVGRVSLDKLDGLELAVGRGSLGKPDGPVSLDKLVGPDKVGHLDGQDNLVRLDGAGNLDGVVGLDYKESTQLLDILVGVE
jgi:hypothetical protein